MLDLKHIRENPELIKKAVLDKHENCDIDAILELDIKRREIIAEKEALEAQKNRVSKEIAVAKKQKQDASDLISDMRQTGEKIAGLSEKFRDVESKLNDLLLTVPNVPHPDVPVGQDAGRIGK